MFVRTRLQGKCSSSTTSEFATAAPTDALDSILSARPAATTESNISSQDAPSKTPTPGNLFARFANKLLSGGGNKTPPKC